MGSPGLSNCVGQSIAALDRQFGDRNAAAVAEGFPDENSVILTRSGRTFPGREGPQSALPSRCRAFRRRSLH